VDADNQKKNPWRGKSPGRIDYSCFELTYADEFSGRRIDAARGLGKAKYRTQYYWGDGGINNELQYYADPVTHGLGVLSVREGKLHITAKKLSKPVASSAGKKYWYASGLITTQGNFEQRYGLFEMRAKVPKGRGLWPAFWLLPSDAKKWRKRGYSRMPEIDIMEQLGHDGKVWYATMHTKTPPYDGGRKKKGWRIYGSTVHMKEDLSKGFHTFSIDWQKDKLIWYIDGVPVKQEPTPQDFKEDKRYMLLNLAVGGNWPGSPDGRTRFPAHFIIDFVKVYKKKSVCGSSSGDAPPNSPSLIKLD